MRVMTYGNTSQQWASSVGFFADLAATRGEFRPLADLAAKLAASPFPSAGLCGLTSMHELIVGPSAAILDNPHLVIALDLPKGEFLFTYRDGSASPWTRTVAPSEVFAALARFLTRRARWYQ
jgi:hypothetical protein